MMKAVAAVPVRNDRRDIARDVVGMEHSFFFTISPESRPSTKVSLLCRGESSRIR
jgi:hypothetical protein